MNGQSDDKKTGELNLLSLAQSTTDQDVRQTKSDGGSDDDRDCNSCENGVCAVTWKPHRPAV
jgi:hypothetical protein